MNTGMAQSVGPWRAADGLVLGIGWAFGWAAVIGAWWVSSGEPMYDDQIRWVGVGAVGVIFAGTASVLWLLSGRRAIGIRCLRVVPVPDVVQAKTVQLRTLDGPADHAPGERLVATEKMRYFHRSGCRMVVGKPVAVAESAEHLRRGRRPCGVCRP